MCAVAPRRPLRVGAEVASPVYSKILVPLDHTEIDRLAVAHAASIARAHSAKLYLLHVEEDVTSQIYGQLASTAEVEAGIRYLEAIAEALREQSIEVEAVVRYSSRPRQEIVALRARARTGPGGDGRPRPQGLSQDLVFGTTIEGVRHELDAPIMIVEPEPSRPRC